MGETKQMTRIELMETKTGMPSMAEAGDIWKELEWLPRTYLNDGSLSVLCSTGS